MKQLTAAGDATHTDLDVLVARGHELVAGRVPAQDVTKLHCGKALSHVRIEAAHVHIGHVSVGLAEGHPRPPVVQHCSERARVSGGVWHVTASHESHLQCVSHRGRR